MIEQELAAKVLPTALVDAVQRTRWAALILVLAAFAVFRPALNRVFVADQINYFAELDGSTSLQEGLRHYDFEASRRYSKENITLFRPVFFGWLAVGNWLFSYHHVWWNLASVALHVLVAVCLFRLLMAIQPSVFALPVALLFAVMKPPLELVVWNHAGGYLLACVFLLLALRAFVQRGLASEGGRGRSATAAYVAGFTAAGLSYESMVPICALAGMCLIWLEWRRGTRPTAKGIAVLAAPVLTFSLLYAFHVLRVERPSPVYRPEAQGIFDIERAESAWRMLHVLPEGLAAIAHWALEVAFPSALHISFAPYDRAVKSFSFSWASPLDLFNGALLVALLGVLGWSTSSKHLRRVGPLVIVLAGGAFVYAVVLCLGRPFDEVIGVTYYLYIFCVMLVVLLYTLVDFGRIQGWTAVAAGMIVAALTILHASGTRAVTSEIGRVSAEPSSYLTAVATFVDAHRAEADFTFTIEAPPPGLDPEVELLEGYSRDPDAPFHFRRVTQILFARHYDDEHPKYVFNVREAR